ncbi:MAG: prolyl oligopeptidase family serine peptidase [Candidatus Dependentiae bacterium]|nr:prolyl oligopeptidase family serine peptidase [Candidatus Dependentiae bacterium]
MNKKLIGIIFSCCLIAIFFLQRKQVEPETETNFYNTKFLLNVPAVEKVLKDHGFFEVDFKTADNLMINAIMLDKSKICDVTATILSCPGFVPGRKEGMSTLYAMLQDQPYNFMFIDFRGHGKSDGELLTFNGIKHYGELEYLDVIASIQYIINYNKQHNIPQNIIIHGLCSGAFHTVKAVTDLKKSDPQAYACIKGIIIDSGWPSITDIAETITHAEATERCKTYHISFLQPYVAYFMLTTYNLLFKESHCKQTAISNIISNIDQPILFIHAENDLFVPLHNVYPLISAAKKPTTWFVKESSHVSSHLKHSEEYTHQMQQFIQSVI